MRAVAGHCSVSELFSAYWASGRKVSVHYLYKELLLKKVRYPFPAQLMYCTTYVVLPPVTFVLGGRCLRPCTFSGYLPR